jgi:hypothetical protein
MESRKIRILEFISDKIECGNCKRNVICIRFGHPTKKNDLGYSSPWEGSHGRSWSSVAGHGELAREGKEEEGEGGVGGARLGAARGAMGRGRAAGGAVGEGLNRAAPLFGLLLYVRRKETGRRKKRREERKKKRRREGKKGKFSKHGNF